MEAGTVSVQLSQVKGQLGRLAAKPNQRGRPRTTVSTSTRDPIVQTKPLPRGQGFRASLNFYSSYVVCSIYSHFEPPLDEFVHLEALNQGSVTQWLPHGGFQRVSIKVTNI